MKLCLPKIALFSALLLPLFAAAQIPEHTRRTLQRPATPGDPLALSEQVYQYFNAAKKLIQSRTDSRQNGAWVMISNDYYQLSPTGKPTEKLTKDWNAVTSVEKLKAQSLYTYDAGDRLVKQEDFERQGSNGPMLQKRLFEWEFDASGRETLYRTLTYNAGVAAFGTEFKTTYDASVSRIAQVIKSSYSGGTWTTGQRATYKYLGAATDIDVIDYVLWNSVQMAWSGIVSKTETYSYSGTTTTVVTKQSTNGVFGNFAQNITERDANGQIKKYTTADWTNSAWVESSKQETDYNANKSLKQLRTWIRDASVNLYYQNLLVDYEYGVFVGAETLEKAPFSVDIFPNPTADFLQIDLGPDASAARFELLDAKGRSLKNGSLDSGLSQIPMAEAAAGAYFLKIEKGGSVRLFPIQKL